MTKNTTKTRRPKLNAHERQKIAKKALSYKRGATIGMLSERMKVEPVKARCMIDAMRRQGADIKNIGEGRFQLRD